VREVGLEAATDEDVWHFAAAGGFVLVSKDADFRQLSFLRGHPPKVIWVRLGNCSTKDIERLLRGAADRIAMFERDADAALLVLA
jgi:predicted nuclease of predicted toxin-antitoxin system